MGEKHRDSITDKAEEQIGRRHFMTRVGATAVSFTIVSPRVMRGTEANSKIRLGIIGCGMRGKWIADIFAKHGGYKIVAVADYFQERADELGDKHGIGRANCYATLSGYKRLLEQKLDAVAIESPPYFHPEQAAAAVDAGVHVICAKPIAIDVPGCKTISEAGQKAISKKQCFFVDFQTRANDFYREAVKRVHYGDIGRIGFGEACFNGGDVWNSWNPVEHFLEAKPNDPEARLKAWGMDKVLSGDILVEQCIHTIDVATWILDAEPVSSYGTGGRNYYKHGDIWDCFAIVYRFPGNVPVLVNAKQFGAGYSDIGCRIYGLKGTIDTHYGGDVFIRGSNPYKGGQTGNLYPEGTAINIAEFYNNITKAQFANPTVAPSVRSNLASILGRIGSYRRREVSWDEMMQENEKLESNVLKQLKA